MMLATLHARFAARLAGAGYAHPRREARALVAHALNLPVDAVLRWPDRPVSGAEQQQAEALLIRRLGGEPLSRIRGEREFWSLSFHLSPATLDPRPDSETLIDAVLRLGLDRTAPLDILDLGTGSGCLLLSLLSEYPCACGIGIDVAPLAARTAMGNAERLGLGGRAAFCVADWDSALQPKAQFDLVISNPPYIPACDIATLDPAVRMHDPHLALDGGPDGLGAYRQIIPGLSQRLRPHGWALMEIGVGQADAVPELCRACDLVVTDVIPDPGGHPRIVIVKRPATV